PATLAVVTSVIVTVAPTGMAPIEHMIVVPVAPQVPCVDETETNVVPFGIGSDTDTSVSSVGPLFVTTIVQVIALPVVTGFGLPVFVIARSVTGDGGGGFFAFVNVHTIASPGPTDTAPPANTCTGSLFAAAFTQESEAVNPETAVSLTKYIPGTTICVPV